jgi:hypothetical protein
LVSSFISFTLDFDLETDFLEVLLSSFDFLTDLDFSSLAADFEADFESSFLLDLAALDAG